MMQTMQENRDGQILGKDPSPGALKDVFTLKTILRQDEWLEAQSGNNPLKYAQNNIGGDGPNGETPEERKKREEQEQLRRTSMMIQMQILSFDGLEISFDQAMSYMDKLQTSYDTRVDNIKNKNIVTDDMYARDDSGRKIETTEQLRAYEEQKGFCSEKLAVDQVTTLDGELISVDAYQMIVKLKQDALEEQDIQKGLENGTIKLEDIPEDLKEKFADVHRNGGEAKTEFTLQEMLENNTSTQLVNAAMLDEVKVTPTVTFSPPAFMK